MMQKVLTPASGLTLGDKNSCLSISALLKSNRLVSIAWSLPNGAELFRETVPSDSPFTVERFFDFKKPREVFVVTVTTKDGAAQLVTGIFVSEEKARAFIENDVLKEYIYHFSKKELI